MDIMQSDKLIAEFDTLLEKRGLSTEKYQGWSNTITYKHENIESRFNGYCLGVKTVLNTVSEAVEMMYETLKQTRDFISEGAQHGFSDIDWLNELYFTQRYRTAAINAYKNSKPVSVNVSIPKAVDDDKRNWTTGLMAKAGAECLSDFIPDETMRLGAAIQVWNAMCNVDSRGLCRLIAPTSLNVALDELKEIIQRFDGKDLSETVVGTTDSENFLISIGNWFKEHHGSIITTLRNTTKE